ncbi:CtsR family transcriptional regulator [Vagococcus coleopterorum]|uniref:CtsR family transcriptional regulator n=1 Tax=Vagococcus coleopterorum TaxID=2714946 RepID=A0A6G8AM35_9ENTE|nr:CtsR family transcriptional regulator [Vagococcus coleopterorum]QIL46012.1 CtsR family transcriptional regulator [Vagococcus coleopterorum]
MSKMNTSDLIEEYIIELLSKENVIELQRFEVASIFNCVPSQINYVINTRFTIPHGYQVISKRGGGGYIRISKVELREEDRLSELSNIFEETVTEKETRAILNQLLEYDILTQNEAFLIEPFFEDKLLENNHKLRAEMLDVLLERLTYKDKE